MSTPHLSRLTQFHLDQAEQCAARAERIFDAPGSARKPTVMAHAAILFQAVYQHLLVAQGHQFELTERAAVTAQHAADVATRLSKAASFYATSSVQLECALFAEVAPDAVSSWRVQ